MAKLNFGGHTYLVVTKALNWFSAEANAEAKGGHLVKIDSARENSAVFNFLTKESASWSKHYIAPDGGGAEYVWIGASDFDEEGQWRWSDGSSLKYSKWGRAEPDNYEDQDGAAIGLEAWPKSKGNLGQAGQWNDVDVTNGLFSLIEYDGIAGGSGIDKIVGTTKADTLMGLGGNDILTGGKGKDAFVFNTKLSKKSNVDKLTDFNVKDDTVRLDDVVFKALALGKLSVDSFHIGSGAHDADDRIIYDSKKGALFYDADGDGAEAQVQFATLSKNLKMTAADFFVI
jgi:Ca2+-binding RTX toxin-like protein